MNDDIKGLRDDIAFMRALAEEGRSAPLLGGIILVTAGTTFGLASLGHWAINTGRIAASATAYSVIWAIALAVFLTVLFVSNARLKTAQSARSAGNRAMSMVWAGVGWGCFTLMLSVGLVTWRTQSEIPLMLIPPMILTLYGVAWSVAAAVSGRRWIRLTALGSYFAAVVTAFICDSSTVYLVYAAALVLVVAAPGVVLMRQEPSSAASI